MRFLHTADWQIGMRAAHVGAAGGRVREERLAAARRAVGQARAAGAEFILVAGDTFEHNGVDRALVQKVGDILAGFGGPVFVIPGNHDPLAPGSVWEHPVWNVSPQLRVLRDPAQVSVGEVDIFPCPLTEEHSRRDPTAWISAAGSGRIRLGLAHGSLEGIALDDLDYPIARDAAERGGLDYLALGHWHSWARFHGPDGVPRTAYSGTHETTRFGERDSGYVLLVEIVAPGAAPVITPLGAGGLCWQELPRELRAPGDLGALRGSLEALASPDSTLVDVRLAGLLFAAEQGELARVRELIGARFLFGRLDESGLRPAPEDDQWFERLPDGVLRETAVRLRVLADPSYQGPRREGATPEVAAQALMDLYKLAGEVGA
ncbi:MAG: DNA repair exonuclease [Acidobacteriota bacterium]